MEKRHIFSLFSTLLCATAIAQHSNTNIGNGSSEKNLLTATNDTQLSVPIQLQTNSQIALGDMDCNTDFWTINNIGDIQRWRISDDAVEGGEIVLSGGGNGLAYCGDPGTETFYCTNYPNTGILKYDETLGWITIPTSVALVNNGGFGNEQYCFGVVNNAVKELYHFNGNSLTLLETLTSDFYTTADVAVDSSGRAWVFKGTTALDTSNLSVYDNQGLLTTYDISFDSYGTYGAFFLNDQLYLGKGYQAGSELQDSIIPVIITGTTAAFGTPITFPDLGYYDMASCNMGKLSLHDNKSKNNAVTVYPNPSNGIFYVKSETPITAVKIYSIDGKLIKNEGTDNTIDITELPNQPYILSIESAKKVYTEIIVKK